MTTTLRTRHEFAGFALVNGAWVSRCKCDWESPDRYGNCGTATSAYLRLHSDYINVRDHYEQDPATVVAGLMGDDVEEWTV